MKYAHIEENGKIIGWYDESIHTSIPTPNIEVSDEVWQNSLDNNHNKTNKDGTTEFYDFRTEEERAKADLEVELRKAKELKTLSLSTLTVTTSSGKTFDGDEIARGDMLTAITVAGFTGEMNTQWKLADNSFATVTLEEMQEALTLSIQKKGQILAGTK